MEKAWPPLSSIPPAGTVELVKTSGFFGTLIPSFTGGMFNHALVHLGGWRIFDAHFPRAGARMYKKAWKDCRKARFTPYNVNGDHAKKAAALESFLSPWNGALYGWLQCLGQVEVQWGGRDRNRIQDGVVCFELVRHVLGGFYRLDVSGLPGPNEITDVDLFDFLKGQGAFQMDLHL